MGENGLPFLSRLRQDNSVVLALEIVNTTEYQEALHWIREHFTFAFGQQIDWSHDLSVVTGRIAELTEEQLQQIFHLYGVQPDRIVTIIWTYSDVGVRLPLYLIALHIDDIWFPVLDDVFLFDPQDTWCMELHHEGEFSIGKYANQKPVK